MTIRILHIVGIMNRGGLENLIMNIYRNIDRKKVQFDFLVTREEKGVFDEEIKELGGVIFNIPNIKDVGYIKYIKNLREFFKNHSEYKVIHCHRDALCSVYLKQARKVNVPIRIAHSHNTKLVEPKGLKGKCNILVKEYFRKSTTKYATHYFACGREAGEWLFGKNNKVKVINNGVDLNKFIYSEEIRREIRNQIGIEENILVIGNVARFSLQKNHEYLINIFKEINDKIPESKLLLIGGGPLEKQIRDKVERLGLEKNVIFMGVRNDVNALLMGMDIFLMPSLFEGLPVSMIEAQATGLHCMISDTITTEVDLGLGLVEFLPLDNTEKWISSIENIYVELMNRQNNRKSKNEYIVERGYDIKNISQKLTKFYVESYNS